MSCIPGEVTEGVGKSKKSDVGILVLTASQSGSVLTPPLHGGQEN